MSLIASQITSPTVVYSYVYSAVDPRKYQGSASLAFVQGIHRWPVNSLHKMPVIGKMFPFDDVIASQFMWWTIVHIGVIMAWERFPCYWPFLSRGSTCPGGFPLQRASNAKLYGFLCRLSDQVLSIQLNYRRFEKSWPPYDVAVMLGLMLCLPMASTNNVFFRNFRTIGLFKKRWLL